LKIYFMMYLMIQFSCSFSLNLVKPKKVSIRTTLEVDLFWDQGG